MHIKTRLKMLPLVLSVALLGCDVKDKLGLGDGNCGPLGDSNVSVTGAATASIDQCAVYGVSLASGASPASFALSLTDGSATTPTHTLVIGRQGARPANGTYNIGTGAGNFNGVLTVDGSPDRTFALTSGTLTITTSSSGTLNGSVNLTATESTISAGTVTITGSFAAKCVDTADNDC